MSVLAGNDQISTDLLNHNRNHKSAKRLSLICSSLVALASGTPYLYGIWSPQLINKCGFSAIDSSYLSFMGNIGSSIGGFFAGLIIDKFGITLGILLGALLEFSGFSILYYNYKFEIHNFTQLLIAMVCIGFGSVLAYFATIKVATLNFPNHRGLANACPVSAYGLAALFYAFLSTVWFNDNVEGLLGFIAIFSGLTISLSSLFIKIYEIDDDENENENDIGDDHEDDHENLNSSIENEFEVGLQYLLKGHRGSFAQVNNILRNESSTSLFSEMTDNSSEFSASTMSRNSSVISLKNPSLVSQNPISISNHSTLLRSNSNSLNNINNNLSSSPLDFKVKQPMIHNGSFRMQSSMNNSPRGSRWFGSMTQKQNLSNMKINSTPNEESPLISNNNTVDTMNSLVDSSPLPRTKSSSSSVINSLASSPANTVPQQYTNKSTSFNSTKALSEIKNSPNSIQTLTKSGSSSDSNNLKQNQSYSSLNITPGFTGNIDTNLSNQELAEIINRSSKKTRKRRKGKDLSPREHVVYMFKNKLFLSHYILNAFYCSIGQVYIFGIGFIVRAQVNYQRIHDPSIEMATILKISSYLSINSTPTNLAVTYQALQVSIISFSNFLGRLISGPTSDLIHKKWKKSKIYVVIVSLVFLTLGQLSLLVSDKLKLLSITSFLIGLSYGSIYGTMPSIVADSWGSKKFATNWALMGTGPISVFLILSDYFGTVYDENSVWSKLGDVKLKMCLKGKYCYWDVFALNSGICFFLIIAYFWLVFSGHEKKK